MQFKDKVRHYLHNAREFNALCTQNGWIDTDSLKFDVDRWSGSEALVSVRFVEIVMEGSGCIANRIDCFGKLRLTLNEHGEIKQCALV